MPVAVAQFKEMLFVELAFMTPGSKAGGPEN